MRRITNQLIDSTVFLLYTGDRRCPTSARRKAPLFHVAGIVKGSIDDSTRNARFAFPFALLFVVGSVDGSPGDADPSYRSSEQHCKVYGCVGKKRFPQCIDSARHEQEPLHVILERRVWDCQSECRFHCMLSREDERRQLGQGPDKYHGKWLFRRIFVLQEPVSVALSVLNLVMHFFGLLSFHNFVYKKLPLRPDGRTYYEYNVLWLAYGILSMSSWFWSAVFHSRDVNITEKLDYSFAVALLGYSLILAILRAFNVRDEAARVMLSAPIIAFVTTHVNFYQLDYGQQLLLSMLNFQYYEHSTSIIEWFEHEVCVAMAVAQLLLWAIWPGITRHPSRWKLWAVIIGGAAAMLLEIYDFPPYHGLFDAHALWHASTIPLTCLWWSFIKNGADFRTSTLVKKKK